jgi:hypothetical protein
VSLLANQVAAGGLSCLHSRFLIFGTYEEDLTDKENHDFRYLLYRFASPSPKVKFNEQNLVSLFVASVYVHEADIYLVL